MALVLNLTSLRMTPANLYGQPQINQAVNLTAGAGITLTPNPITGVGTISATGGSITFPITVAQGGTGLATLTAGSFLLGNGTGNVTFQVPPIQVAQGGSGTTTAFTSGSVVFAGAAGVYTQDVTANNGFSYDPVNHNLQLGFADPASKISIFTHAGTPKTLIATNDDTTSTSQNYIQLASGSLPNATTTLSTFGPTYVGTGLFQPNSTALYSSTQFGLGGILSLAGIDATGKIQFFAGGSATANLGGQLTGTAGGARWDFSGPIATLPQTIALSNGLNSNIVLPWSSYVRISGGVSAPFSVGGLTGGVDGRKLTLFNSTANTMTIVNEDASSSATNRITTLTGGNVTLAAGSASIVDMIYDATNQRWILDDIGAGTGFIRTDGTIPLTANWNAGAFNILSKNSFNVYNVVTGYGADPTGAADSTTPIQNAINAAQAAATNGGGIVYLPAGSYKISTTLSITTGGITLKGDNMSGGTTIIWSAAAGASDMILIDGTTTPVGGGDIFTAIHDLRLNGNAVASRCINIKNAVYVDIWRVRTGLSVTEGSLVTATAGLASFHVQFRQCSLSTLTGIGVHASGSAVNGLVLTDCEIGAPGGGLVADCTNAWDIKAYGTIFEGSGAAGCRLEGSAISSSALTTAFTDCYWEANTTAQLDINPSAATGMNPHVSVKGGQMGGNGTTANGIRLNPVGIAGSYKGMLTVEGLTMVGHTTADIVLGSLSAYVGQILIEGNSLLSTTPLSYTNAPAVGGSCIIIGSGATDSGILNVRTGGYAPGVVFTQTATSVTTANTASTLFGTGKGTLTLPANALIAGRAIRIQISGFVSQADALAATKTLLVSLGGTTVATAASAATVLTVLNDTWTVWATIVCYTAGSSGTVWASGEYRTQQTASAGFAGILVSSTAAVTINTTIANAVNVTLNNGSASGTHTTTVASIELLN